MTMAGRNAPHVAIIGGGAGGVLSAAHLVRAAGEYGRPLDITVLEPGRLGAGIAYSTRDAEHRLNVPAAGMSALPDDPEHFLRWHREHRNSDLSAGGFAPRRDYAAYVVDVLTDALDTNPDVGFEHIRTKVTDIAPSAGRWQLALDGGTTATADAIVLALGAGPPSVAWAPAELLASPHFIADPWAAPVRTEDVPGRGGTVLLVGAGLTMADMAITWGRGGATVHAVSRHGLMPLAHMEDPPPKPPPPALPDAEEVSLGEMTHYIVDQLRTVGDWRLGTDSLRAITADLWRLVPIAERVRALQGASGAIRRWGRIRHRVAPDVGAWLDKAIAEDRLVSHEGTVATARQGVGNLEVRLTDRINPSSRGVAAGGTKLIADVVVNCTGPANEPSRSGEPLLRQLLSSGLLRPHPVGIGLDVDEDGRPRSDRALPPLWTIGPLRQGELWESTAIPEIRNQAAELPTQLLQLLVW
ncbi:MAG TPA: FAD/NAD(P)-binding protein [Jatrophihabitans sp.]|jgi:uncharacterized NAD(P)/FAD-binding protein YdhS